MNEFIKVFLNQRSLRAALRELSFEQLTEAKEKLDMLFKEREEAELKVMQEQEERQAKLAEFQAMLEQAGIDRANCWVQVKVKAPRRPQLSVPGLLVLPSTNTPKMV